MKIVIYDPLYSKIGHYERYSNYIVELFGATKEVSEIVYFTEMPDFDWSGKKFDKLRIVKIKSNLHSFQELSIKSSGVGRLKLGVKSLLHYRKVLLQIKKEKGDKVLFLSQGFFSFWIALKFVNISYSVSVISIKWLFQNQGSRKYLKKLFESFLKKANSIFFTEQLYVTSTKYLSLKNTIVLPDRYLELGSEITSSKDETNQNEKIKLVTLGTISLNKNPIKFLKEFNSIDKELKSKFEYLICGKVLDKNLDELFSLAKSIDGISLKNEYIKESDFDNLYSNADIMVIPYPSEYTNYATSGIMWDCFTKKKLLLCPDNEIFNYYINKYGVGFTYKENNLSEILKEIANSRKELKSISNNNYNNLYKNTSFEIMQNKMRSFIMLGNE